VVSFFFFQAEDGIRDSSVTGVQTCALPISDDLTKLHNARYLRQYLVTEMKRARRYGSLVSSFFLDLDDFKQVNDRHGHLVGSHEIGRASCRERVQSWDAAASA